MYTVLIFYHFIAIIIILLEVSHKGVSDARGSE